MRSEPELLSTWMKLRRKSAADKDEETDELFGSGDLNLEEVNYIEAYLQVKFASDRQSGYNSIIEEH